MLRSKCLRPEGGSKFQGSTFKSNFEVGSTPFKAFQATAGSKRSKVTVVPIAPLRLRNQKPEMSKTLAEFHIARGTNTSIAVRTQSLVLRFIPVDV
jgi:hypothetical protein